MNKLVKLLAVIGMLSVLLGVFSSCMKKTITIVESDYSIVDESNQGDDPDDSALNGESVNSNSVSSKSSGGNTSSNSVSSSSKGSTTSYKPGTEKKLTGKLELQVWVNGSDTSRAWERTVAAFEKANPALKVDLKMGINVNTQMQTRWMSGNPPDFINMDGGGTPTETLYREGMLYDLTNFFKTATPYGESKLISDKLINECIQHYTNGKVFVAPLLTTPYGLWYDNSFLKKNNLTVPTNFNSLMSFGAAAKAKGIPAMVYPGIHAAYLFYGLILPSVAAYGQDYFTKVTGVSDPNIFAGPEFKSIMQRFLDFVNAGYIMQGSVPLNHINAQMSWLNNKAALIPCGLWMETEMASDIPYGFDMRFTTMSLTKDNQKQSAVLIGMGVAIAQKGKNRNNALEFLRYLYRDEVLLDFVEVNGYLSSCKIDISKAKLSNTAKQALTLLNSDSVDKYYKTLTWGSLDDELANVLNAIVLGNIKDVDVACARIVAAAKKVKG